jgi:predicted esterase
MADAVIVSVQAPDAQGSGRQWFSVQGVTEDNRPARVAATMPRFVQAVREWQQASGVDTASTTLIGFSQGAIMPATTPNRSAGACRGRRPLGDDQVLQLAMCARPRSRRAQSGARA